MKSTSVIGFGLKFVLIKFSVKSFTLGNYRSKLGRTLKGRLRHRFKNRQNEEIKSMLIKSGRTFKHPLHL